MAKVYQDAVGTVIRINMGTDVSAATAVKYEVMKPNGAEEEWTAALDGDDEECIVYTVVATDLDQVGEYLIQPKLTFATWVGLCDTVRLVVHPAWDRTDQVTALPVV